MKTPPDQIASESVPDKANSTSQAQSMGRKMKKGRATLCEVIDALEDPASIGTFVFRLKSLHMSPQTAFVVLASDPDTAHPIPYAPGGPCLRAHLERTGLGQVSQATLADAVIVARLPKYDWPGVKHFNDSFRLPDFARTAIKNTMGGEK
jgi:hypothetical protein